MAPDSSQAIPTDRGGPRAQPEAVDALDVLVAVATGLVAAGGAWLARQPHLYGDGPGLVAFAGSEAGGDYYHALVVPLLRAATELLGRGPSGALAASHLVLATSAGLAIGGLCALLRALGLPRGRALFGAGLLATTPGFLFFATTVEVHVLHVAAVVVTGLVAVAGPWHRPVLATVLVGLCLGVTYGTHVSTPLLGPGFVALCQVGALRAGRPLSLRQLLLGVGPALLTLLVVAMGLAGLARTGRFDPFAVEQQVEILDFFHAERGVFDYLLENVLGPTAAVAPLALVAVVRGRLRGWPLVALVAAMLPSWVFFQVWGVRERGAYFLPTVALLCWPAAMAWRPGWRVALAAPLAALVLVGQLLLGLREWKRWNDGWSNEQRIEVVDRVLPGGGQLLVLWRDAPTAALWRPDVSEISVDLQVSRAMVEGREPASVGAAAAGIDLMLADGPVAVDVSYTARSEFHARDGRLPYQQALEAAIRARYEVAEEQLGVWRMLAIVQPLGASDR